MNITIWLLKMACFLLHTSHILSNIYNSANFPDRLKHLQTIGKNYTSSSLKFYTLGTVKKLFELTSKTFSHALCLMDSVTRPACFGSNVDPSYCVISMEEVYCGTMAQMKKKKRKRERKKRKTNQHSTPRSSTGRRHQIYYHLLRRQVWAQYHVKPNPFLFKNVRCGT